MKIVIQRVNHANVVVNENVVGKIGKGICCLVGIEKDDTDKDMEWIIRKIINVRLWPDDQGKHWCNSVKTLNYEILLVSQFTLHAVMNGNRPDFHLAMNSEQSKEFYLKFVKKVKEEIGEDKVQDGEFGAMMKVSLENDGPVTLILDSKNPKNKK